MTDKKVDDKKLGDVLKKVASLGMGAAFMTEDAIKNIVADLPMLNLQKKILALH